MTLRRTEIIEWSTTPKKLRRIADDMEFKLRTDIMPEHSVSKGIREKDLWLQIKPDYGQ